MIDPNTIIDLRVEGIDRKDYPDFSDAYFSEGWIETSLSSHPQAQFSKSTNKWYRPMSEDELNELGNTEGMLLNTMAIQTAMEE